MGAADPRAVAAAAEADDEEDSIDGFTGCGLGAGDDDGDGVENDDKWDGLSGCGLRAVEAAVDAAGGVDVAGGVDAAAEDEEESSDDCCLGVAVEGDDKAGTDLTVCSFWIEEVAAADDDDAATGTVVAVDSFVVGEGTNFGGAGANRNGLRSDDGDRTAAAAGESVAALAVVGGGRSTRVVALGTTGDSVTLAYLDDDDLNGAGAGARTTMASSSLEASSSSDEAWLKLRFLGEMFWVGRRRFWAGLGRKRLALVSVGAWTGGNDVMSPLEAALCVCCCCGGCGCGCGCGCGGGSMTRPAWLLPCGLRNALTRSSADCSMSLRRAFSTSSSVKAIHRLRLSWSMGTLLRSFASCTSSCSSAAVNG